MLIIVLVHIEVIKQSFEVIEGHPEDTVFDSLLDKDVLVSDLLADFFGPQRRVIGPITFKFCIAPWISELDKFDFLCFYCIAYKRP